MTAGSGGGNNGKTGAEPDSQKTKRRFTADVAKPGVSASSAAVIELDLNGFVTVWSPRAEQMYGYEPEEIVGKHVASLFCEGELEQGRAAYELHAIHARKVYKVFGWQRRKSGQQFWTYTEGVRTEFGFRLLVAETPQAGS
jgi:PAS domain S-box-containing protein